MNNFFRGINRIEYRPDASPEDTLVFRHYNPSENVLGRPMEEWLRFSPCFFNAFRYFGSDDHYGEAAHLLTGEDGSNTANSYKKRIQAAFEFFDKLGVRYYSVSDRDLSPDYDNFEETVRGQKEICGMVSDFQREFNIRPLYFSCDLFSHPRYANGSSTNPDSHVFAYACAQLKHALDMAKTLGAENFVFFHPRDGYQSVLQRNIFRDMSHMGQFYRMALRYKEKIGYNGQFLIQPKPFDPRRIQYEADAMTVIAMLKQFGLERYFKLYIKPGFSRMAGRPYEHDVYMASAYNMLGMVDASDSWPEVCWTSDIAPYNVRDATQIMKCIIEQGGLNRGGLTLGFRKRRESIEPRDHFHAYILAMDTYACALRNAACMINDGLFQRSLKQRYQSYRSGLGERLETGNASIEECEDFVRRTGSPTPMSSRFEHFENMFNTYVYPPQRF